MITRNMIILSLLLYYFSSLSALLLSLKNAFIAIVNNVSIIILLYFLQIKNILYEMG